MKFQCQTVRIFKDLPRKPAQKVGLRHLILTGSFADLFNGFSKCLCKQGTTRTYHVEMFNFSRI